MREEAAKMYKKMKGYGDQAQDAMQQVRDFFKKN